MDIQEQQVRLRGIYSQPYSEIVRPERVWKISKYFLRRWTPYLPASHIWLIIGARQESYFNQNRPWFTAYDQSLAAAAGISVRTYRRTAKKEMTSGASPLAAFIGKVRDPGYVSGEPTPRQEETEYSIRLDDPLTPADAEALAFWLRRHAPVRVTAETLAALLEEARQERPQALRAVHPEPGQERPQLLTVADVVAGVFPDSVSFDNTWREAADRLHTHLVEPHLCHLESQYLRQRWLPDLGPGPALLFVYLRSLGYYNPQTEETRDQVSLLSGELEELFQKSSVTLRSWFARLDEFLSASHPHGPFLEVLGSDKLASQKVETTYRLNLLTPLHPDDLLRYQELAAGPLSGDGVTQLLAATPAQGDATFGSHDDEGDQRNDSHVLEGHESSGSHVAGGEESFDRGWEKKWQPYKYYRTFLSACGVSNTSEIKTSQEQHEVLTHPAWKTEEGEALLSFAAAAVTDLEGLFIYFNIQGEMRKRIRSAGLSLEAIVAWYLYSEQEAGLSHPARYMMKQAAAGLPPPERFLALAQMSWEQWRVYATTACLHVGLLWDTLHEESDFSVWQTTYGTYRPTALPLELGQGIEALVGLVESKPAESEPSEEEEAEAPVSEADRSLWRTVLDELSRQMTKATFSAWLRDAKLVARTEDTFVVGLRDEAARDWVEHRLEAVLIRTLQGVVGEEVQVRYVTGEMI